jgi:Uma2 family endonuclease
VTTARRLHHTYAEYLAALEMSDVKLEYCDGEMYAMAGGTPAHAQLIASVLGHLGNSFRGRCNVYASDLKIRIEATDLSTFPDATVVCGQPELAAIDPLAVTNPTLIVEVTRKSTEDYDRGEKLNHYKQIPSLESVLIVSHRRPQITVFERAGSTWEQREYRAGERVTLADPELALSVDELYAGITLES